MAKQVIGHQTSHLWQVELAWLQTSRQKLLLVILVMLEWWLQKVHLEGIQGLRSVRI